MERKNMKTILLSCRVYVALILVLGSVLLSSCAQCTAMKQPKPFKPTATVVGAKRADIAGELGNPVNSEQQNILLLETYKYVDGGGKNNGASKTGRVILYTAGDLFTIFLDQILTWPAEIYGFAGTTHIVTVEYIKQDDGFWHAKEIKDTVQGTSNHTVTNSEPVASVSHLTNAVESTPESQALRPTQPTLATIKVINYQYDNVTRKGTLSVDVSDYGLEARNWVLQNIGKICSSKNLLLEAGKETDTGGKYRVLNESMKNGILTIEFTAGYD
jgi:hypothetical protein